MNNKAKYCLSCGNQISAESDFCPFCGANQSGKAPVIKSPPKTEDFQQAIQQHIRNLKYTVAVLIVCFIISTGLLVFNHFHSVEKEKANNTDVQAESTQLTRNPESTRKPSKTSKILKLTNGKVPYEDKLIVPVDYQNHSWVNTKVTINRLTLYKTKQPVQYYDSDNDKYFKVNGIVVVHYKIETARDINIYPTMGTLNTSDGQQIDADTSNSDDFDGEINKGATTDGNIVYPLKQLKSTKSLSTLRLKWDADYDTNDDNDENSSKTYDVTLKLE